MTGKPDILEGRRLHLQRSLLARWRAEKGDGIAYFHVSDAPCERRSETRRPRRLRWGKTLDADDRFLAECLVVNRTMGGACLQLARNIVLPTRFQLFEDDTGVISGAEVVWRRAHRIGCRVALAPTPGKRAIIDRMRARYYAL
jgi:hypothetical protein